jgi:hypothetical protein
LTQYDRGTQAYKKAAAPYDLKATHYQLGTGKPTYESTTRSEFGWKDPSIGTQDKALVKDLRAHHFEFGNDPNQYTSEAAAKFKEVMPDKNDVHVIDPYKNSFKIGDGTKGQHDHYKSVYKQEHVELPMKNAEINRKSAMDQVTSILFGTDKGGIGVSEHADK